MKQIITILTLITLCAPCNAEVIRIYGNMNQEERERQGEYLESRNQAQREYIEGMIQRTHERNIEVLKYRNALMLERASAPNIALSSVQIASNDIKTSNEAILSNN